jgi:hypothetical protein
MVAMVELSVREKSICGSLVAVLVIAIAYFCRTASWIAADAVDPGEVAGLSVGALILLIAVQLVFQGLLALASRDDPTDERERLIAAVASRNAYIVLQVGLWLVICHIVAAMAMQHTAAARWFAPFATAQLGLLAAIAAELAKYCSQLVYYRRGI